VQFEVLGSVWNIVVPAVSLRLKPRERRRSNSELRFRSGLPSLSLVNATPQPATVPDDRTYQERLERFVELQKRAMQLLKSSPEGYRRFWERNLRQRRIHAKF
jgi:hypothetical protein